MRAIAGVVLLLLLAGCGPRLVETDVTRFHTLPTVVGRGTFTILPTPAQQGSLEFQNYASMVAAELQQRGYRPLPPDAAERADYVVRLDWGVGEPVTEIYSAPSTTVGGTYVFGGGPWYRLGTAFPLDYPTTRSITRYPKWLAVIMRRGLDEDVNGAANVFEGRAVTTTGQPAIQPVMPYLVEALFTNFPGESGRTVEVDIPIR